MQTEQEKSEKKLGSMPPARLLAVMSLPMMISFLIQAMYNIVDSIFVARISEHALTAVSLAFPMQTAMHAIAVGLGVGINAGIPRNLGRGRKDRAYAQAAAGGMLNLAFSLLFLLLGLTAVKKMYASQTDVQDIITGGTVYLSICWSFSFGEFFGQYFEKLLVCTGSPLPAMISQGAGAVFNIIFDPLLIFGIGPFPEMGIAGAASATVMGQILAALIALMMNLRFNHTIRPDRALLHPDAAAAADILTVGFPSMVTIGLASVSVFSINQILLGYSTTAAALYGIWSKLQNFCFMPLYGMNNGMVPILSYNHAKHLRQRTDETIRLALLFAFVYLSLLTLILLFMPDRLLLLFKAGNVMKKLGIPALRVLLLSLVPGGVTIILTSSMQAMNHARYTLAVSILRQFVLIGPLFAAFSILTHRLGSLWAAVPVTEVLSLFAAVFFMLRMRRLPEGEPLPGTDVPQVPDRVRKS